MCEYGDVHRPQTLKEQLSAQLGATQLALEAARASIEALREEMQELQQARGLGGGFRLWVLPQPNASVGFPSKRLLGAHAAKQTPARLVLQERRNLAEREEEARAELAGVRAQVGCCARAASVELTSTCIYIHTCTYIYIHVHIHTYIYIHIHMHAPPFRLVHPPVALPAAFRPLTRQERASMTRHRAWRPRHGRCHEGAAGSPRTLALA
jgi:hypothetical protein